jgi:hypothetical protein
MGPGQGIRGNAEKTFELTDFKNIVAFKVFPAVVVKSINLFSSTLKMEAIYSFETSVETQRTTRRHIAEDDTL